MRDRWVVWWYRTLVTSWSCFILLIMVDMSLSSERVGGRIFTGVVSLVLIALLIRALRSASVELSDAGIGIRGALRTKRIPWSEIKAVHVSRGSSAYLLPWRVPGLELRDGSTVLADEFRSLRTPSKVDALVAEIRERLRRHAS